MEPNWTKPRRADPHAFSLVRDAGGRLVLIDADGQRHVDVEAIRGFPLSDSTQFISICDSAGRELICIENLESLPENLRQVLEAALADRKFMPVIERIVRISLNTDPSQWEVETDRGNTKFQLKSEDDIRRLDHGQFMIADDQGIRYLIPNVKSLDAASRRALERFIL